MKIAVFGSTGMLGHKIYSRLEDSNHEVIPVSRSNGFDVLDTKGVERFLTTNHFDVIVNCIGIVKQREQSLDPYPTIVINGLFPHRLQQTGARLIHFSTDCVFKGDLEPNLGSHYEWTKTDAIDLYGQSKAIGEVKNGLNALTLRTSIIGREVNNHLGLLEWFLSQNGKSIKGYTKSLWSGVTTNWLADTVVKLIDEHPKLSGLYQVTSNSYISKHDLLVQLKEAYGLTMDIVPDDSVQCDRRMSGESFESVTGIPRPTYPEMIAELVKEDYESIPK